ncbi:MAG: hypothetical protein VKK42_12185 [Lyngbya sp.]|nr:hypothetical protein [Lyngbya sp.]
MSEQVEKIKKLIKTATNPKQKAMYQDLLTKLQTELGSQSEVQEESRLPTEQTSQPPLAPKPNRVPSPPKSSSVKSAKTKQVKGTASSQKSTPSQVKPESKTSEVDSEQVNQQLKSESDNSTDEKVKFATSKLETSSQSAEVQQPSSSLETSSKLAEGQLATPEVETSQTVAEKAQVKQGDSETSQTKKEKSNDNIQTESEETKDKTSGDESESDDEPESLYYFQGIGIIKGEVTLTEERSTIKIGEQEYRLFYIPNRRKKAYEALKREIDQTQNPTQRLIVYPRILHFPKKDQPHRVSFQVVGFIGSKSKPTPLNEELKDFEFKFSGLWQFIPVCRTPCISIFRNFNKERLAWIKEAEAVKKVKFMKASHVPLLWRDSPVKPFRFNPKLEKEQQGKTYFVQIKAKFLPGRDVFGFVEQLEEPTEKAPGFLKASKKVKAEALAEVKDRQKQQSSTQSPDQSEVQQPKSFKGKKPPVQHPKNSEVQPDENSEVQQQNQQETQPPKKPKPKKQKQSQVQQQENSQVQEPSPEQQENYQVPESNPSQVEQQENSQNEQSKPLEIQQPLQSEVEQLNQLELRELQQSTEIEPPEKSEFEQS